MDRKQPYFDRVCALRERMEQTGIDAYLVLTDDFHASEYVGDHFKCRAWVSGFTGSAGILAVTKNAAGLWTDGRYFIQAADQLAGTGITLYKSGQPGVPTLSAYLAENLREGQCVGYDGRTVTVDYAKGLKEALRAKNVTFRENVDLVGQLWTDRPALPEQKIWLLGEQYTGKSRARKLTELRQALEEENAGAILIASLDDIAWLYNLRGSDIAYNPVALAYTLVYPDRAVLYISPKATEGEAAEALAADGVELRPYLQVYEDLKKLEKGTRLWADTGCINVALLGAVSRDVELVDKPSPTTLAKAIKTPEEMENMRLAHIQDGVAVTKAIYWIKQQRETQAFREGKITELTVSEKLAQCRKERPGFLELSFESIVATGPHGAIVHYDPTPETDIPIQDNTFLLMDTGGQYMQGTTDITRTIVLGTVTGEMKKHFTAVLRGNLALGGAKFKHGCTGVNLDYLARSPLWEMGLDYNHGTGHGVGYLLNVHEGPNGIRLRDVGGKVGTVLEEGMITSNEPGFYLEGQYGIRCENLILCKQAEKNDYGQFMAFETLTMVPFDVDAIDPALLSEREKTLLNDYHQKVYETLSPYLEPEESQWLFAVTRPV